MAIKTELTLAVASSDPLKNVKGESASLILLVLDPTMSTLKKHATGPANRSRAPGPNYKDLHIEFDSQGGEYPSALLYQIAC